MAIDPVASAADALAAHLKTAVPSLADARLGWPEHAQDMDLTDGPIVTVTPAAPDEERIPPRAIGSEAEKVDGEPTGNLVVTYKVAFLTVVLQLDAWAPYKATLDDLIPLIEAALQEPPPGTSGLWLTQSDYYSRPLSLEVRSGPVRDDGSQAAEVGEWRARWELICTTDKVALRTFPKGTSISFPVTLS